MPTDAQPVSLFLATVRTNSPERSVTHVTGLLRGLGIGAGLLVGYGIYRSSQGQRDWKASTAISTGLSMALVSMARTEAQRRPQARRWMRKMRRTVCDMRRMSQPILRQARKQMARMKLPQIRVQISPSFR